MASVNEEILKTMEQLNEMADHILDDDYGWEQTEWVRSNHIPSFYTCKNCGQVAVAEWELLHNEWLYCPKCGRQFKRKGVELGEA